MPEQLTKYPEVTLQVLRSGAARCGEGLPPQILTACPPERFCRLPGGELCVYGLPEASQMRQISAAEARAAWPAAAVPPPAEPGTAAFDAAGGVLAGLGVGLGAGLWLGLALARRRSRARR